jgi:hypothetical protein
MIENSLIVEDTRKIRCAISEKFNNDSDKYIDYLMLKNEPIYKHSSVQHNETCPILELGMQPVLYGGKDSKKPEPCDDCA